MISKMSDITVLTTLLVGMTMAVANSTYAASEEKNVVQVKAAAVQPSAHLKVLVFPVVIKEVVKNTQVEKADSKVLGNSDTINRNPFFVRNPFNFEEPFEEFE